MCRRVDVAEEHVRKTVGVLLPGQEGVGDRAHLPGPRRQRGAGRDARDDCPPALGGGDCAHEQVCVAVEGEGGAVAALAAACRDEDDGDVRPPRELVGGEGVVAIRLRHARALRLRRVEQAAVASPGGEAEPRADRVVRRRDEGRHHSAGAATADDGRSRALSEERHPEGLRAVEGQHAVVLEQHDRARRQAAREGGVGGRGDVVALRVRVVNVEGADAEEGRQDAQGGVVDPRGVDLAAGERRLDGGGVHEVRPRHLLVEALRERHGVRGAPIGHDPAAEAEPLLEVPLQRLRVLARPARADLVVRAHGGADACS
mmetsp:Transcript_19698/g.65193  ORF Transcript_19698/g.65193 Transcript_19698/m.65193 type:complete len:316 (-) Transcript_19698:68-1015(-)